MGFLYSAKTNYQGEFLGKSFRELILRLRLRLPWAQHPLPRQNPENKERQTSFQGPLSQHGQNKGAHGQKG